MQARVAFVIPTAPPNCFVRHKLFVGEKRPFIGVAYLIAMLRGAGCQVDLYERHLLGDSPATTPDFARYDAACFYASVAMLGDLGNLLEQARGKCRSVVGGPHATLLPGTFAGLADCVVVGEGEQVIVQATLGRLPQRLVRADREIADLDSLPTAAFDVFAPLPYHWVGGFSGSEGKPSPQWLQGQHVWNLNTSRGCPSGCQFCTVPEVWGRRYRAQSAERVLDDMLRLQRDLGADGIYFREDNFMHDRGRVENLCQLLLHNRVSLPWVCEARVDSLQDPDLMELMVRAGCRGLYIGLESGSPEMLRRIGKGITVDQARLAVRTARRLGLGTAISLMHGFPCETDRDRAATDQLVAELQPDWVWRNHLLGVPTSRTYHELLHDGTYLYEDEVGVLHLEPLSLDDPQPGTVPGVFLTTAGGDHNHPWVIRLRKELAKQTRVLFYPAELCAAERSHLMESQPAHSQAMRAVLAERSRQAGSMRMARLTPTLKAIPRSWPRIQLYTNDTLPAPHCDVVYTDVFLDCMRSLADHDADYVWPQDLLDDALAREREVLAHCRCIWVTSRWVEAWGRTHLGLGDRVRWVGAGPTILPRRNRRTDPYWPPRILFMGNDFRRKGLDLLLDAYPEVLASCPEARLVVISADRLSSPLPVEYHEPLNPFDVEDAARLEQILSSCTLYVQPSRFEPFGLAYVDAMGHGLAIVGPEQFALQELISDGETGRFCELSPAGVARAILECIRDREQCARMGCAAYERQQSQYHWPAVVERMLQHWQETVARTPPPEMEAHL